MAVLLVPSITAEPYEGSVRGDLWILYVYHNMYSSIVNTHVRRPKFDPISHNNTYLEYENCFLFFWYLCYPFWIFSNALKISRGIANITVFD